ncbi:MAG: PIG-L deacetylase family protein [Ilumatobacteraceae bacterium]
MTVEPADQFRFRSVLAVCAHPDDESFGLGAVISTFGGLGIETSLLCFTHGEASTLGTNSDQLADRRAVELEAAAAVLGIRTTRLLSYPDGHLSEIGIEVLSAEIDGLAAERSIDCLLVFDESGITGHPDHQAATAAARATADRLGLHVLAWTLPRSVAEALNVEFGAGFVGRDPSEIDLTIDVDRTLQHEAIKRHATQSNDNPVLRRRLSLQDSGESLIWLDARRNEAPS